MRKSVLLMAGLMTVALAGSAQAAGNTMFAVQNAGSVDKTTISDTGDITTAGSFAGGLQNIPTPAGFTTPTNGAGAFHYAVSGNTIPASSFLIQQAVTPISVGGSTWNQQSAPNFAFYRINKTDAATPVASLPTVGSWLGYLNFGTIDPAADPAAQRINLVQQIARAEAGGTSNPNAWLSVSNLPAYLSWWTTHFNGTTNTNVLSEKMRLSSQGNLGIGTAGIPTAKLQVVGLQICPDNLTAKAALANGCGGLTAGSFYIKSNEAAPGPYTANGQLMVVF
jgi:hypothetical protein